MPDAPFCTRLHTSECVIDISMKTSETLGLGPADLYAVCYPRRGGGSFGMLKAVPWATSVREMATLRQGGVTARYGLTFLSLLSFFTSFFGSRVFTTLYPDSVVVSGGIHFHHFWIGILLVAASGGLALSWRNDSLQRVLAVTYGAGLGLIGDEVGLLLTFGDYNSLLTYEVVLGALAVVLMVILLMVYSHELEEDVLKLTVGERLIHVGVFAAVFSGLFVAFGLLLAALACLTAGVVIAVFGFAMRRRKSRGTHA
jgi:hypothetical protein